MTAPDPSPPHAASGTPAPARAARGRWLAGTGVLLWAVLILGGFWAVPLLNLVKAGGFPLGYWFAAQGGLLLLVVATGLLVRVLERSGV